MKWWEKIQYTNVVHNCSLAYQMKFGIMCHQKIESPESFAVHFENFSEEQLKKYAVYAVMKGLAGNLNAVLSLETSKTVVNSMIDGLIECAIHNKQHEMYLILLNYKYENNLFQVQEKKFDL